MAVINTVFEIRDKVHIKEIDKYGMVVGFWISGDQLQLQYQVRYFKDGDVKDIYFYDFELEKKEKGSGVGFALNKDYR